MTGMQDKFKPGAEPDDATAICTLFEGDFHLGLAAFLNSLFRSGYTGTVWAGFRGSLPPWVNQLRESSGTSGAYAIGEQLQLVFVPLAVDMHLTNYKPRFMLDLLAGPAHGCDYLWYFDPDICVRGPWEFFARWQRYGIALCQEIVDNNLPENAPLRHQWAEIASSLGLSDQRLLNHYYNGGMLGVAAAHADFLDLWERLIEHAGKSGCDLKAFMPGNREMPFHASDQDALNIAAMFTPHPLSTLGPQGMGFIPGDAKMYHTVGQKPWRGSFFIRALSGVPPSSAMKYFLTQVSSPIRAYSSAHLAFKKFGCAFAALIGRFYRRMG
jgi:hypothetical protein